MARYNEKREALVAIAARQHGYFTARQALLAGYDYPGQPQAVFSHETALALHALSDVNPARIHLTVPPGFRRQLPPGMVIHRAIVPADDWEEWDGYRVTTPLRTLTDIAATPASWPSLEPAVRDALRAGMVRRRQLLEAELPEDVHARLVAAVDAVDACGAAPASRRGGWSNRAQEQPPASRFAKAGSLGI